MKRPKSTSLRIKGWRSEAYLNTWGHPPQGFTREEYCRIANRLLARGKLRHQWVICMLGRRPTHKEWYHLRAKLSKEGRLAGLFANPEAPPIKRRIFSPSKRQLAEDKGYAQTRALVKKLRTRSKILAEEKGLTAIPPTARELRRKLRASTPKGNPDP